MQVLLCGFDDATIDRLSLELQQAGHGALGATSEGSARSLIAATSPGAVFVPDTPEGDASRTWLTGLIPDAQVISLAEHGDPIEALARERESETAGATGLVSAEPDTTLVLPTATPTPDGLDRDGSPPELLTKLHQVRFSGYHEVLEVEPGDTAYVIREQHDRLVVTYSSGGWPGPVAEEDVPLLDEIGQGIREAYSVLGVPEYRAAYEEALRRTSGTV